MKKAFISLLLTILIICGINVPVFADEIYVPSIGVRTNVTIEGGEIDPETGCSVIWDWCEGCHRKLVVTPYFYKDTIESNKSKSEIEEVYQIVTTIDRIADLNEAIIEVANQKGIEEKYLVARDIFDITPYYCDLQGTGVELTLSTDVLTRYVCLLHYVDGEFEIVPEAYVTIDDHHLYLRVDHLSTFVVIAHIDENASSNINGSGTNNGTSGSDGSITGGHRHGCIWHWFIIITLLITAIVAQLVRKKDHDSEKDIKRKVRFRNIMSIINLILCIIFFILGFCGLDLYALIADIIVLVIIYIYTKNSKDEE